MVVVRRLSNIKDGQTRASIAYESSFHHLQRTTDESGTAMLSNRIERLLAQQSVCTYPLSSLRLRVGEI